MSDFILVPQDQVVTVSKGGSATFRYSMGGESINYYYVIWYRRTQGSTMDFIYRDGDVFGPGFQNRSHGRVDVTNNQAVLEIFEVSERDEGFYYCSVDNHPATGPLLSSSKTIEIHVEQQCQQGHDFLLNK